MYYRIANTTTIIINDWINTNSGCREQDICIYFSISMMMDL